jgi:hypothetical protein
MHQNPTEDGSSYSSSHGFPRLKWNQQAHYCVHERLLLAPYLTDMNHLNNSTTIYLMSILIFPSYLSLCLPSGLHHLEFMTKIFIQNYFFKY